MDALEKYADQLQQSIISIPLFLTRTRCDLNIRKNSFTNAQVNSFIMQWCSIHQGKEVPRPLLVTRETTGRAVWQTLIKELNFSGAKTPKVFYTHATKTILKHYGLAEPTLLQRYIVSFRIFYWSRKQSRTRVFPKGVVGWIRHNRPSIPGFEHKSTNQNFKPLNYFTFRIWFSIVF